MSFGAAAPGATPDQASQWAVAESFEDVWDRLDELAEAVHRHQSDRVADARLLAASSADFAAERSQNKAARELTVQVLQAQGSLVDKFSHFERSVLDLVAKQQHGGRKEADDDRLQLLERHRREVKNALSGFRNEVVELAGDIEARFVESQATVEALTRRLTALEKNCNHVDRLAVSVEAMSKRLDVVESRGGKLHDDIADVRVAAAREHHEALARTTQIVHESTRSMERQLEDIQTSIHGHATRIETLERAHDATADRIDRVVKDHDEFDQRQEEKMLSTLNVVDELRKSMEEQAKIVSASVQALEEDFSRLSADVQSGQTDMQRDLADLQRLASEVHSHLRTLDAKLTVDVTRLDADSDAIRQETETLVRRRLAEGHLDVTRLLDERHHGTLAELRKVQLDVDARHQRLVESTHHAINQLVDAEAMAGGELLLASSAGGSGPSMPQGGGLLSLLRREVSSLRESVNSLHKHRSSGSGGSSPFHTQQPTVIALEAAVSDMRDTLDSLDRKYSLRSEVDHLAMELRSELSTVKQITQSCTSVLGQKVDMERSAREVDVSNLRGQVLRLQQARLGGTTASSPSGGNPSSATSPQSLQMR